MMRSLAVLAVALVLVVGCGGEKPTGLSSQPITSVRCPSAIPVKQLVDGSLLRPGDAGYDAAAPARCFGNLADVRADQAAKQKEAEQAARDAAAFGTSSSDDHSGVIGVIVAAVAFWMFIGGLLGAYVAQQKRRSAAEGVVLGALFGLVGVLIVAVLPTGPNASSDQEHEASDHVRCGYQLSYGKCRDRADMAITTSADGTPYRWRCGRHAPLEQQALQKEHPEWEVLVLAPES